jgi:uncharacterized cupredoxin-like copper-binding protein
MILGAVLMALFSSAVWAHGDQQHAPAARPSVAGRTIQIEMTDEMRFTPSQIRVKRGETVRFVVANKGQVMHEMVIGTMDDLKEHAAHMKKHPNMEHTEANMAHVAPGRSGEIVWQFSKSGEVYFGCLVPGHFDAGMIGKVVVE